MKQDNPPLLSDATARRLFVFILAGMIFVQAGCLAWFGNGLSHWDAYDEADAVRSGEAYAKDGLTSHHGLPRILYGNRFSEIGARSDHIDTNGLVLPKHRIDFPANLSDPQAWVYTHYPPGPNLICGALARVFGPDNIRIWRLFPICLALAAWVIFFKTLVRVFCLDRGVLIFAGCAVLPMSSNYMPGLHFEGYTLTLLLLQLSVLIRWLWLPAGLRCWHLPAIFFLGFAQGWLSFDHFFIVSFAAFPLWLMRRAEGAESPIKLLALTVGLPFVGFGLAHFFHLLQIAAELGGLPKAVAELTHTAVARAGTSPGADHFSFLGSFAKMSYLYLRDFLRLYNPHFGPFLFFAVAAAMLVAAFCATEVTFIPWNNRRKLGFSLAWAGSKGIFPAIIAAFFVSAVWSCVMPAATVGNFHIWQRTLFYFYFVLVLTVVRSVSLSPRNSTPNTWRPPHRL